MLGKKKDSEEPSVRIASGTYQRAMLKKLVAQIVLVFMAALLVYLCFAATIVRVVPSSAGFLPVKNNTYPGGIIPVDAQVLIDLDPESPPGRAMKDRLAQSFVPQKPSALVSVLAGPIGEVKWAGGVVTVDGEILPATLPADPGIEFLEDQYFAVCISGDCLPGEAILFISDQVIGIPFKQDASIPPPAVLNGGGKINRSDPLEVTAAYLVEGYQGNSKLSCSLLTPEALKSENGITGCSSNLSSLKKKLGVNYDFENMKLSTTSESSKVEVQAELITPGKPVTIKFELVSTEKGLAISKITRGEGK